MSKKFMVSRQLSLNGNPPIKVTYRYAVSAETPEEACGLIAGDWSISLSKFINYPENLSSTDVIKFIGEYTAEEVQND